MKQKAGSLKKIKKIDRYLANLTKMRREQTKIRSAKGEITTNTTEIQAILRDYLRTYIPINLKILKK
jgi:hypothetical protein